MNWLRRWTKREYSEKQRLTAVILGGVFFWLVIPLGIVVGSYFFDCWFHLPRFAYGAANSLVALLLMVPGWLFANWTIKVQYSLGKGTPIPVMATQKLVIKKPYMYCRNPMNLGTAIYYIGVAAWVGIPFCPWISVDLSRRNFNVRQGHRRKRAGGTVRR